MRKLIVLEANEVPLRVLREVIKTGNAPNIDRLLSEGSVSETVVSEDENSRYLYPSQTWATLATGVDYDEHGVYWYGDPKPDAYPLYWQLAAQAGRSVGLVGTLHSSPFASASSDPSIKFAIPDCFADDPQTKPERYSRAQAANIELSRRNGRNSSIAKSAGTATGLASLVGAGLSMATIARVTSLTGAIAAGQVPRERLRLAQDLIFSDVFLHLGKRHDADLSLYFTNHVASMMHRYWYAMFPQDWDREVYPDSWRDRYRGEIPAAVSQLDRMLGRLMAWAEETDRAVLLVSSMGQQANLNVDTARTAVPVLRDEAAFAAALGLPEDCVALRAMVPTQSWRLSSGALASEAGERLRTDRFSGGSLEVDVLDDVVSVTYRITDGAQMVGSGRFSRPIGDSGFSIEGIDDHTCGVHDPVGTFALWNAPGAVIAPSMSLLDVAPGILGMLGVDAQPHHREVQWVLGSQSDALKKGAEAPMVS